MPEYIFPRVEIIEENAGPRPPVGISLSTIGIVGTFEKGPVNQIVSIGTLDKLVQVFGGYNKDLTGYKSALAALLQGAKDFKIVRIGGDSIKEASLKLKDSVPADVVEVKATTPGTWGNAIKVAVVSGTTEGTFKLVVVFGTSTEEFDNLTLDTVGTIQSKYITATKLEAAANIPANIESTPLAGGDNGATTEDTDYVGTITEGKRTGLKLFETIRVAIVLCAQQSSAIIQNALITHCSNMTTAYGLRMSVLNSAKGLDVDAVSALTANMDSMRAIFAYPWCEIAEIPGEMIAPDGLYAGRLAILNSNQSPSNKLINGIISQETDFTDADIKTLTLAKISPIAPEPNRGYRIKNGISISSDPAWSQTNIRRIFDEIEMEVYDSTQWAKSEDNTPTLRLSVAMQIDSILELKKQKGKLYDYKPTVCDDTNNTAESIAARILNTKIRIRPNYAADFIDHSIQRLVGTEG